MDNSNGSSEAMLGFQETARARRSCRAFRSEPLPDTLIHEILADAQTAPSNCNTQPWSVHVVSGAARDRLADTPDPAMSQADFGFDQRCYSGALRDRMMRQGQTYYKALGVERQDASLRQAVGARNLSFFGAPHVAFCSCHPSATMSASRRRWKCTRRPSCSR